MLGSEQAHYHPESTEHEVLLQLLQELRSNSFLQLGNFLFCRFRNVHLVKSILYLLFGGNYLGKFKLFEDATHLRFILTKVGVDVCG